jgi:hypothetical protein
MQRWKCRVALKSSRLRGTREDMKSLEPHTYQLARSRTAKAIRLFRADQPQPALQVLREVESVFPYYTAAIAWQVPILDRLGEFAKVQELYDFSNNVLIFDLSRTRYSAGTNLAQAVALTVRRKVSFRPGTEAMPLVKSKISDELSRRRCPVIARFRLAVLQCLRLYLRRARVRNPGRKRVEDCWLSFWSTRIERRGSIGPHYHARSWVSWVFYPSMGAEHSRVCRGGDLELGCIPERMGTLRKPRILRIQPQPGSLIVFPSYMGHAVKPVKSLHPRISIAGDLGVMPRTQIAKKIAKK